KRPSVYYSDIFAGGWMGHSDYSMRWQKPGDELITNVPSMVYPAVANRDRFYDFSSILIEKGDHIRLEDLSLGYNFVVNKNKVAMKSFRVFTYISNLGIIWRGNSVNIDPYYNNSPLKRPYYSFGINFNF